MINSLSNVHYLSKVPYDIREELHYKMTFEHYEKNARIFNCGQVCQQLLFIVSGEVELIIESQQREYSLEILGAGTVIGQYSIINESEYQYMCKAKGNVSLLVLDRTDLLLYAERFERIAEAIEIGT